jgi:hypothetical protein
MGSSLTPPIHLDLLNRVLDQLPHRFGWPDQDLSSPAGALTACLRKLLTILNAMLKSGTPWQLAVSQSA